jgi:hypothetical protein
VSDLPAKDKPPHDVNVLGRRLTDASKYSGIAVGRLRRWLGFMVVAAMLDRARDADDGMPLFLIKGGVAMELRFGSGARATKDFDTAVRAAVADVSDHLDPALRAGFGDFAATRTEIEQVRDTGAVRFNIKLSYRGRSVVTVPVEVAEVEGGMGVDVDQVPAQPLDYLGLDGPATVPCVAVRWQIAQKLHACTEQVEGRANDRFRDLVDLQLLADLIDDWPALRKACIGVFEGRGLHAWPPVLTVPESWIDGYRTLADDMAFEVADVYEAAERVEALIARIDA